jgi:transposase-like protein
VDRLAERLVGPVVLAKQNEKRIDEVFVKINGKQHYLASAVD